MKKNKIVIDGVEITVIDKYAESDDDEEKHKDFVRRLAYNRLTEEEIKELWLWKKNKIYGHFWER